jgi:hypothetical protein
VTGRSRLGAINLRPVRMVLTPTHTVLSRPVGHGSDLLGGHAEFMHIYTDATILIPDGVSYGQGTTRSGAAFAGRGRSHMSGWRFPAWEASDTWLSEYARASGFETIAISRSPDKNKMIKELGADEIGSLGGLEEMRL